MAENLIFKSKSSKTAPAGNVFKTITWCDETYVQCAFSAPPAVWPRITSHALGEFDKLDLLRMTGFVCHSTSWRAYP